MGKIFITGATGTNGKVLVKKLAKKRVPFVIGTRNIEEAHRIFGNEVEIRKFDFADSTTFTNVVTDIEKVFVLGPPLTLKVDELIVPFLDFIKSHGISRIVYFSALASDKMGDSLDFHQKIEQKLQKEGYDYTILKPSFFAQNFKNYESENILERGIVFMPAGNGKVGFIDVDDIADVAIETLTSNQHSNKIYELTGPELLSYHDVASILSEILNKQINYPNPTPEQFKKVLEDSGAPIFIGDYLANVYQAIANSHVDYLTDTVEVITGKKPTSVKEVLFRDFIV